MNKWSYDVMQMRKIRTRRTSWGLVAEMERQMTETGAPRKNLNMQELLGIGYLLQMVCQECTRIGREEKRSRRQLCIWFDHNASFLRPLIYKLNFVDTVGRISGGDALINEMHANPKVEQYIKQKTTG